MSTMHETPCHPPAEFGLGGVGAGGYGGGGTGGWSWGAEGYGGGGAGGGGGSAGFEGAEPGADIDEGAQSLDSSLGGQNGQDGQDANAASFARRLSAMEAGAQVGAQPGVVGPEPVWHAFERRGCAEIISPRLYLEIAVYIWSRRGLLTTAGTLIHRYTALSMSPNY